MEDRQHREEIVSKRESNEAREGYEELAHFDAPCREFSEEEVKDQSGDGTGGEDRVDTSDW